MCGSDKGGDLLTDVNIAVTRERLIWKGVRGNICVVEARGVTCRQGLGPLTGEDPGLLRVCVQRLPDGQEDQW